MAFSLTQIYQINLKSAGGGTTFTHRRRGRWPGSWDFEVTTDLEKLVKLRGASLYAHVEGSWSEGLDDSSVGSLMGINRDAAGYETVALTELYWEQHFFHDKLAFRIGKLDMTFPSRFECGGCPVSFDGNAFANTEVTQFINASLVNNPTIPFPDKGLAIVGHVKPVDWWYVGAGIADAQGDAREAGFNTAFHEEAWTFSIVETGVVSKIPSRNGPMTGAYRVGFWFDPQDKDNQLLRLDGRPVNSTSHDCGFYISVDQTILKENNDPDDDQGVGLFGRYGLADSRYNEISSFWSVGGQYKGLIPRRDNDVIGVGVGQGTVARDAGHTAYGESVIETYYSCEITPWLYVTPSVQYVWYPGAERMNKDAVVISVRLQFSF